MIIKQIKEEKIKSLRDPVLIYGIGGGFGNVAHIVGKTIIKSYPSEKIAKFILYGGYLDSFYVTKKGKILDMFSYYVYNVKLENRDYIVLYGITQPIIPENPFSTFSISARYKLALEFVKFAKKINVKEMVLVGGFSSQGEIEPEDPKLYILYNKYYNNERLKNLDIKWEMLSNIQMMGVPALMIYLSDIFKIPAISIWAQTYFTPQIKGFLASSKVIDLFNKLYGLNIDNSKLKEKGLKLREKIKNRIEKLRNLQNSAFINKKDNDNLSFYFG